MLEGLVASKSAGSPHVSWPLQLAVNHVEQVNDGFVHVCVGLVCKLEVPGESFAEGLKCSVTSSLSKGFIISEGSACSPTWLVFFQALYRIRVKLEI